MQIGGLSDTSMIYQHYAEMARQRRLQGAVGMEETDEVQDAADVKYAAGMQQSETQQLQQAQEVAPSMEVGDRASERGNADPADMYRMLTASALGFAPANASEFVTSPEAAQSASSPAPAVGAESTGLPGGAGSGSSFWNEILKSFSDVGAYSRATSAPAGGIEFNNYMRGLVNNAYGR